MTFERILAVFVLAYWVVMFVLHARGLRRVPHLPIVAQPLADEPLISIIVAAKDEENAIAHTLRGIAGQEYGNFELIAINDRSDDHTGEQMEAVKRELEQAGSRVPIEVVHIEKLPPGWLGKNHALYQGSLRARGDYILFTDADIEYEPVTLRSAFAFMQQLRLDHLTVAPFMLARGFWLRGFVHFFLFALCMLKWPWRPNDDNQHREGFGIGAFNFITRDAYEKIGTHRELAMRPDDDLQLGQMVKRAHLKQRFVAGSRHIRVEWYPSVRAAIRGLEKNMFAGLEYSVLLVVLGVLGQVVFYCYPFFALWLFGGWMSIAYAVSVMLMMGLYLLYTRKMSTDRGFEVIVFPFVVLLFVFILIRSTALTLARGGINWRGTFYSLEDLKKMK